MTEKEMLITNDIEGFTPEDYLHTPSYATIMEEYTGEANLPEKILHNNTPILDQGSIGACSVFGITKAENEADWFDSKTILDAMKIWDDAVAEGRIPNGGKEGRSMSGALNLMKEKGYIQGYYFCSTPAEVRLALSKRHMCYTGARYIDWHKTGQTQKLEPNENKNAGHLFALTGIDNQYFYHPNSRGRWRGDKGFFKTPFEDQKWLYSIVAIIDKKNASPEVVADAEDNDDMVQKGIWNGKLPNEALTKIHAIYMLMRAFREQYDDAKALEEAVKIGMVNNPNGKLTRRWFLKMLFVAKWGKTQYEADIPAFLMKVGVIKSLNGLDEPVKRYHASLMIARALKVGN